MTVLQDYGRWLARQQWTEPQVMALIAEYRPEAQAELLEGYRMNRPRQ